MDPALHPVLTVAFALLMILVVGPFLARDGGRTRGTGELTLIVSGLLASTPVATSPLLDVIRPDPWLGERRI